MAKLKDKISPLIISGGTPAFDSQPRVSLRLVDTRAWDDLGHALARYEVCPEKN